MLTDEQIAAMSPQERRDLIKRFAAAGAAVALPALAQPARIVLGQSAAFSGPAEQLSIQMNQGARIYFDALNASGGINGRTIELRTLDDGYLLLTHDNRVTS